MTAKPTLAEKLAAQASDAAELRNVATNPDVVALRVERTRRQVDVLAWTGIVLGLGFTMTNVQAFAAGGAVHGSPSWWAAWALDPMVSFVLIALLRTEQTTARWKVRPGAWVRRARWGCLAATYAMNTWTAWDGGSWAQVLLHSVPVAVVFVATEAITDARESLTEAIHAAADAAGPTTVAVLPVKDRSGVIPLSRVACLCPTRSAPESGLEALEGPGASLEGAPGAAWSQPGSAGARERLGGRQARRSLRPSRPQRVVAPRLSSRPPGGAGAGPGGLLDLPPTPTGNKTADARAWARWKWTRGELPKISEVNESVGSNSLVKRAELEQWRAEFDAEPKDDELGQRRQRAAL